MEKNTDEYIKAKMQFTRFFFFLDDAHRVRREVISEMTSVKRQAVTIEKSPKSSIKHTHHDVGTDQTVDSDSFYLSLSLSLSLGFEDSIARDARVLSLTFPSCLMGTMSVRLGARLSSRDKIHVSS